MLLVGSNVSHDQPVMLTEFGGIGYHPDRVRTWGYTRVDSPEAFRSSYQQLLEAVRGSNILAGFCYTQFTDTYQEANGLLYADRTPKFPIAEIRAATSGNQVSHEPIEWEWREPLDERPAHSVFDSERRLRHAAIAIGPLLLPCLRENKRLILLPGQRFDS